MRVVPVAGQDSMLLNLSGAHAPLFTRNIVILTDSSGHTGLGEVPGGEAIAQTLEDARPLIEGQLGLRFAGSFTEEDGYSTTDKDTATFPSSAWSPTVQHTE